MALTFHAVFRSNHPPSLNIPLLRTYLVQSRESNFPANRKHNILSHNRLLAARGIAAYLDDSIEASSDQLWNNKSIFDDFLSGVEFLSLASSAAVYVYFAVKYSLGTVRVLGSKILAWQSVILVCGLMAGVVIRRRQWSRLCGTGFSRASSSGINRLERIEKLEQDLRSCTTSIHVLSKQLEKLGIRFRVSRKTLRQPISETADLVQKTWDATKALAAQEDILERELIELQKVLLAMQEQQQKQLELILAIGKTSKLWGDASVKDQKNKGFELSSEVENGEIGHEKIRKQHTLEFLEGYKKE